MNGQQIFSPIDLRATCRVSAQSLSSACLGGKKQGYHDRALQIYSQYLSLFQDDHNRALVNLRMGHLLRNQMGAMDQAIEHFHT